MKIFIRNYNSTSSLKYRKKNANYLFWIHYRAILHAHALDAVQEKLPRAVDVKRPGWSYPREYGLSKKRRKYISIIFVYLQISFDLLLTSEQLMSKMFHIMDTTLTRNGLDVLKNHTVMNTNLKEVLQVSGEPMLVSIKAKQLLCSKKPLEPYSDSEIRTEVLSRPLPSIYPLEPTISIFPQNIYRLESLSREFWLFIRVYMRFNFRICSCQIRKLVSALEHGHLYLEHAVHQTSAVTTSGSFAGPLIRHGRLLRQATLWGEIPHFCYRRACNLKSVSSANRKMSWTCRNP